MSLVRARQGGVRSVLDHVGRGAEHGPRDPAGPPGLDPARADLATSGMP